MIFNSDVMYTGNGEMSKYPVGLEGALMHIYENECNYNALMKAAGVSELKYYQETGKDLFVHEASAFESFIEKAKAFFKKVIDKIKAMFHKFAAVLNKYTMDDKKFVKTYENEIIRKDIKDFEFEGYKFDKDPASDAPASAPITNEKTEEDTISLIAKSGDLGAHVGVGGATTEQLTKWKDNYRGVLLREPSAEYDMSEFREKFKEKYYGDKETLSEGNGIDKRALISVIKDTKKDIKNAEDEQKKIIKDINDAIKALDDMKKKYTSVDDDERKDDSGKITKGRTYATTHANNRINVYEDKANSLTAYFGMIIQWYKDRNRQAKAICVKIIGYSKKESYSYSESSVNDLFAGVTIR